MKTWGHRTISSTRNLVGSLEFLLKNIISIMQGSVRVFWRAGSALIFHSCPNHCLISSVSKGESRAWHRQRTRQVLHYIRSVLFLPVFSKCSRMTQFLQWIPTCLRRKDKGRKEEVCCFGFFLFLLFSFPFSTPPSSLQLQVMQQFSHKTTSNLLFYSPPTWPDWESSLSRYLEIGNRNC